MKMILKSVAILFTTTILLSSCLGDGSGSKIEQKGALSYITSSSISGSYAIALNATFTSDLIKTLNPKRFYYLDYEVATKDGQTSEGVFYAKHTALAKNAPIARGVWNDIEQSNPVVPEDRRVYPLKESMKSVFYTPFIELDDRWILEYTCFAHDVDTKEDAIESSLTFGENNIRLVATVVTTNQKNLATGEDLPYNQVVVDLHLEKKEVLDIPQNSEVKSYTGRVAIDLSGLRRYLKGRNGFPIEGEVTNNEEYKKAIAAIQFRYKGATDKEGKEIVDAAFGNLDDSPTCYMVVFR